MLTNTTAMGVASREFRRTEPGSARRQWDELAPPDAVRGDALSDHVGRDPGPNRRGAAGHRPTPSSRKAAAPGPRRKPGGKAPGSPPGNPVTQGRTVLIAALG